MDAAVKHRIGELLMRKSAILKLMGYMGERALQGDIKEIRDFSPEISLSEIVLKEREER